MVFLSNLCKAQGGYMHKKLEENKYILWLRL